MVDSIYVRNIRLWAEGFCKQCMMQHSYELGIRMKGTSRITKDDTERANSAKGNFGEVGI